MKKLLLAGVASLSVVSTCFAGDGIGPPPPLGWVYGRYLDCYANSPDHGCYISVRADGANIRRYPNGPVFTSLTNGVPLIPYNSAGPWVLVAVVCNLVPVAWSDTAGVPLNTCGGGVPVFGAIGEALRAFGAFRGAIGDPQPVYPPAPPMYQPPVQKRKPERRAHVVPHAPHALRTEPPLQTHDVTPQSPQHEPSGVPLDGGPVVPLEPSPPSHPPKPYQQR